MFINHQIKQQLENKSDLTEIPVEVETEIIQTDVE